MAKHTIKEKYAMLKARARRGGAAAGRHLAGAKPLAVAGAIGAAAYFVQRYLANSFDFIKNNWYGVPVVLFILAFVVAKKRRDMGIALAGAAGYALAMGYNSSDLPAPGLPPGGKVLAPNTRGEDAGLAMGGGNVEGEPDTGLLFGGDAMGPEDFVLRSTHHVSTSRPVRAGKPAPRGLGR